MKDDQFLPQVSLRAIEPEDLELLYSIENDPQLWCVCASNVPYSKYILKEYISSTSCDIFADRQLRLMIDNEAGTTVGIIDIIDYEPRFRRAELGVVIRQQYRHLGYAAAAIAQVVEYAKNILHVHMLYAFVTTDNQPSIQLFTHAGFLQSAILKDWFCEGDDYKNAVVMQLFL